MFEKKFIEVQKEVLLKEEKRLESEIKKRKSYPEFGASLEDTAQEVEVFGENVAVEGSLEKGLDKVKKALERIEKGIYGKCVKCGELLAQERLKVYPAADIHVKCPTKKS